MLITLLTAAPANASAASPVVAPDENAELVAEFRAYFEGDRTPEQRREAVLNLADADSLGAVEALVEAFQDEEFLVRRAAIDVVSGFKTEPGARYLVDGVLLDRKMSKKKDVVAASAEALGGMGHEFALDPLLGLLDSRDLAVRLGTINGLGALGSTGALPSLTALVMSDEKEQAVIISALDALGRIGDGPGAEAAVLASLDSPHKAVRIKAVKLVETLRLKNGVRPLIMKLDDDLDPRVSEDSYEVLTTITLRNFENSTEAWLKWWDRNETRFELPDLEKIAEAKALLAAQGSRYAKGKVKTFENIQTKSDNIVFVIDVSQSMSEPFGDPDRLKASGREYDSLQRLEIVKQELINTINTLDESTSFNIVAYATDVELWKKKSAKASILNRNNAANWVGGLKPRGGSAASFRARMGHNDNTSDEGRTNTHLALMTAFGEDVEAKRKSNAFDTKKINEPVDTIFFLTDGEPTVGKSVDMLEIRQEVARVNAYRGVQIHVIYVGAYGGNEFKRLAEDNGGVFVSIGG